MISEVRIRSRKDMQQEAYRINEPCIIISISDLDKWPIAFPVNDAIIDVKCFTFEDEDDINNPESITRDDAEAMAAFVTKWANKPQSYICYVNCEAGLSRSAGIGAAIAKFFLGDDSWIFRTKVPNRLCYRFMLDALYNI